MLLVYEELEGFIERLKKEDMETTIYMTVIHSKKEPEVMTATIRMQFMDKNGIFHTFNYTEGIHEVELIPIMFIERISNAELKQDVREEYTADIDEYNASIKREFDKAKTMFENIGYKKIVNAFTA